MQWERASTSVDGLEIEYWETGAPDALPILLLHGWASSGRMWFSLPEHLFSDVRLIAPDLPGHGSSSKPEADWYSIPNFRHVVTHLAHQLRIKKPVLVGHSMGGTVAMDVVLKDPGFARAAVLINPVISGRELAFPSDRGDFLLGPALRLGRALWPSVSNFIQRLPDALYRHDDGRSRRMHRDLASTTADSALGSMNAIFNHGLDETIGKVQIPLLVVVGTADLTVSPNQGRSAAEYINTAQLVEIHTGHNVLDQEPTSLAQALDDFLRERVIE